MLDNPTFYQQACSVTFTAASSLKPLFLSTSVLQISSVADTAKVPLIPDTLSHLTSVCQVSVLSALIIAPSSQSDPQYC